MDTCLGELSSPHASTYLGTLTHQGVTDTHSCSRPSGPLAWLTLKLLLATPIILGHQLHGQVKLDAGQPWPRGLPLDAQRTEVVKLAALLIIGSQVQQRVAVAGDRHL